VISLSEEHGLLMWLAYGKILRGWASGAQGSPLAGISDVVQGMAECQARQQRCHAPYHLSLLAETLHRSGRTDEGLCALAEALALVEETEERWCEAELHRLKGELLLSLATPDASEAESCYRLAIAVAQRQGAKMLELRAATSLARLWREQGKCTKAYDLLEPIFGWFTEGFSTSDLNEARQFLGAGGQRSA
jgi:predicted ATPase